MALPRWVRSVIALLAIVNLPVAACAVVYHPRTLLVVLQLIANVVILTVMFLIRRSG